MPAIKQIAYGAGGLLALDINGKLWIYRKVDDQEGWIPFATEVINVV